MVTCLWFDNQAEEAAKFYTSVFKDSKLGEIARYSEAGFEQHRRPAGSVMSAEFELNGQRFVGINGGPIFSFSEAVSVQVLCETQEEIDYYWEKLLEGGGKESVCGWLKDRFGFSWQITPKILSEYMKDPEKAPRVTEAFMQMKKLDIEALKQAANAS